MTQTGPDILPLSMTQTDIWLSQVYHGNAPLFNIGGHLRINGPVDEELFQRAHRRVLEQNDALRMVLVKGKAMPGIRFSEELPPITIKNFSRESHDPAACRKAAADWMHRTFVKPFDLYGPRLGRRGLLKVSDTEYYYLSCHHHMIMDGFSYSLLVRRIAEAYNVLAGRVPAPGPMPSYADLIWDDRAFRESEAFRGAAAFWGENMADPPRPLVPRRYAASFHTHTIPSAFSYIRLDRGFYNEMKRFAKQHQAGIFHLVTAVLYAYFLRTTGAKEFVFGMPMLNRSTPAFKATVGPFVNVMPVRLGFGSDISLLDFFRLFSRELMTLLPFQRFPLSEINRLARLHRTGRMQLFDIGISYERFPYDATMDGSPFEVHTMHNGYDQNALSVAVKEYLAHEDVKLEFCYNRGAFTDLEITYLMQRIRHLLSQVMENPSAPLATLDLVPETERSKLVRDFNIPAGRGKPPETPVTRTFEAMARARPDAWAVTHGPTRLTYRELAEKSSRLAWALREKGTGPGDTVGLYMRSCPGAVVSILGILRAGAAWVPLDPSLPDRRICHMAADAGIRRVLAEPPLPSGIAGMDGIDIISPEVPAPDTAALPNDPAPDDPAYIIYTSGTTGTPKGVVCTHGGLANLAAAQNRVFHIGPGSRVLQFAALSFDASVSEIFTALTSGACLCLADRDQIMPGPALASFMEQQDITHVTLPPSALAAMEPRDLPQLSTLVTAGEPCPAALAEKWGKNRRFINAYGPTEATVCAAYMEIQTPESGMLPLERPLDNTRLYLLDDRMAPVPLGVPGQLYIGGAGVAKGYLNRPGRTARCFVPDPFDPGPIHSGTGRLYKTGDILRFATENRLEFLGRKDDQVKVRGYRIEPGEIEAVMLSHPRVREAAVTVLESGVNHRRLAGHFVPGPGSGNDVTAEVKQHLRESLPGYMVPPLVLSHDSFPRTPSGKIDRRALAQKALAPDSHPARRSRPVRADLSATCQVLKRLFQQTMASQQDLGPDDDFFEAGMDSLRAIGFLAAVEKTFGKRLLPSDLLARSTIALLAANLGPVGTDDPPGADTAVCLALNGTGSRPPFFCVTAGYGDLMAFRRISDLLGPDQPFYLLQPPDPDVSPGRDPDAQSLAACYLDHIRQTAATGPCYLGGYSAGGLMAYETARQMQDLGLPVAGLILLGAPIAYAGWFRWINRHLGGRLVKRLPDPQKLPLDFIRILHALFRDPGLQQQLKALDGYVPKDFTGTVHYLQGRRASSRFMGMHRRWAALFKTGFHLHLVPGNHDNFLRPPHVAVLAHTLGRCLDPAGRNKRQP